MLPESPGVYRMLNDSDDVLYVGKARALSRRVMTYTQPQKLPARIQRMIAHTRDMAFVHTHTEVEALLLESNLIKTHKPPYNVLLRDDKSFPFIMISGDHDYPRIAKHRGARRVEADYYGPFASAGAVNRTITALQKAFMLRNCSDYFFSTRSRPCLQYHIKRCTAPCVGYVTRADYDEQVRAAKDFLSGKSTQVQQRFAGAMQAASENLDFETAAHYRDRIRAMTSIQASQDINVANVRDADIFGLYMESGQACIQVFFFRGGQNFGNRAYFPRHAPETEMEDILGAFITQFYENKPVPREILTSHAIAERELIEQALSSRSAHQYNVRIHTPQKGKRRRLIAFVTNNAKDALKRHMAERAGEHAQLNRLAEILGLEGRPQRIEVYDNSHVSGTNMVGVMIVAGDEGFRKNAYRKFNIREAEPGDDYAMMREVLTRRFARLAEGDEAGEWPDLVIIDGGRGQLNAVHEVLYELGVSDDVMLVSIAKGAERGSGHETLYSTDCGPIELAPGDALSHYIQRLRDEAHRFAIGAHRNRREKAMTRSALDDVPGIGPRRKKALLHHFGSAKAVERAGLDDLEKVEGISRAVARKVYDYFHGRADV
jgi:excinuclease ABC subunit C